MTEAELIARGDRNYYDAWSMLARTSEGGEVHVEDGLLIASPASDVLWLNIAFVTKPLARPEEQLAAAKAYFARRGLSFLVRIREGLDDASERACEALGMPYTDTIPGMLLHPVPDAAPETPGLEIVEADARTFDTFVQLNAASFEIPLDDCRRIIRPALLDEQGTRWFLGLVDGRPVATSALIVTEDVAGVHFVSTDAAHRRRGLGEAMTWHAACAAGGLSAAYLEASEMGYPVYERMGFRRVTGYKTFVPQEA